VDVDIFVLVNGEDEMTSKETDAMWRTRSGQPKALWLAGQLRDMSTKFKTPSHERGVCNGADQELRQLHAVNTELLEALKEAKNTETLKLALDDLIAEYCMEASSFVKRVDEIFKQALAAPVQDPMTDSFVQQVPDKCDRIVWRGRYFHLPLATPPSAPPAAQPEWVPVTKELLNAQHPWLYEQMWIAMKDGSVMTGHYKWMQGRYPDRFVLGSLTHVWAFEATHVMPFSQPKHPNTDKNT
jgi:hypothetical protein